MTTTTLPPRSFGFVLGVSALLGAVVAVGFELFETASHELRELVWVEWAGTQPSGLTTVVLATVGGLAVGLTLLVVPGHGGPHPAEQHGLEIPSDVKPSHVFGVLVAGFVALVAGASLGPEGAVIPAVVGFGVLAAKWSRVPAPMVSTVSGAGLAALLATMFGSPLAGAVPLLEALPASGASLVMLILPALLASSTAVLTLQLMDAEAAGYLQLGYEGFARGDVLWAIVVGVAAGAVGLFLMRFIAVLRRVTAELDRRSLVLTTTVGGAMLGVTYVIGGDEVRFTGIPELQLLLVDAEGSGGAAVALVAKVVATGLCVAIGYRGGRIFPMAFIGGALGLTAHLAWDAIPVSVAVGAGLAGAMAVGVEAPVTAALITAAVVGPEMLPLAIIAVVAAHSVHLLAKQLGATAVDAAPDGEALPTT